MEQKKQYRCPACYGTGIGRRVGDSQNYHDCMTCFGERVIPEYLAKSLAEDPRYKRYLADQRLFA